jgi:acylphosphatase
MQGKRVKDSGAISYSLKQRISLPARTSLFTQFLMATHSMQRRTVFYRGRVQGVGFRYTARRIAKTYAVTGYVRNLADGRVELVAEGNQAEINRFLAEIVATMESNIHDVQSAVSPATGQFPSFEITD